MALHHAFANSKLANVIKDLHVSLSVVLITVSLNLCGGKYLMKNQH
jgi:hypothetical protein